MSKNRCLSPAVSPTTSAASPLGVARRHGCLQSRRRHQTVPGSEEAAVIRTAAAVAAL